MNTTTITGNLVRDPELKFTNSGQAVANFSIADNRRWQDRTTQQWQESTTYVDVAAWGDLGHNTAESLSKGDRVTVTGRIEQRTWETPEGEKRSKLEITAQDVSASVRFATVAITKAERAQGGEDDGEVES